MARATGTTHEMLGGYLVAQAANALTARAGQSEADRRASVEATVAAMQGLAPRDPMEGMMAAQMAAAHNAAMDCLRQGQADGLGAELRGRSFRQAALLAQVFARYAEILDRRRGVGPSAVTVERVTVEAGGQAVVGTLNAQTSPQVGGPRFAPGL